MTHREFPLPEGHVYGPGRKAKMHDGTQGHDGFWLAYLQKALRLRWGFAGVYPTGHLDVATQAALVELQRATGANPSGWLDRDTWNKVFTLDPRSLQLNA